MGNIFFFDWEVQLIEYIQNNFPDYLIQLLKFISEFGSTIIAVSILGVIYWCFDKQVGRKIILASVLTMSTFPLIKNIFLRTRPYIVHESIDCLKPVEEGDIYDLNMQGYSFPSGHSAIAMSLYLSIYRSFSKTSIRILSIVLIILVGVSRFTVGVHYPTDVLAGWAIGLLMVFVIDYLEKRFRPEHYYPFVWIIMGIGLLYCDSSDYYSAYGTLLGFTIGDLFERKYVNFTAAKTWLEGTMRIVFGVIIYLGVNYLLKLPFSIEFNDSTLKVALLYRTFRYIVSIFICFGIYPLTFKYLRGNKL